MKLLTVATTITAVLIIITLIHSARTQCSFKDIRLYDEGSVSSNKGMLQVCNSSGQWTAVCDYNWEQSLSVVVCKQLGYNNSVPFTALKVRQWNEIGYVFSSQGCHLNSSIASCLTNSSRHLRWYTAQCSEQRDTIYIDCTFDAGSCSYKDIRLYANGTDSDKGMLQICNHYNQWSAVCDYYWKQSLSVMVCKQLGYTNTTPITILNAGPWNIMSYQLRLYEERENLLRVDCEGRLDDHISDCLTNLSSNLSNCNLFRDAVSIDCSFNITAGCSYGDIRLYARESSNDNPANGTGMLQLCDSQGRWTAVCDYNWGYIESDVACRQLGFIGTGSQYLQYSGTWPLFGFGPYSCSLSVSNLFNCYENRTYQWICNPLHNAVWLQCLNGTTIIRENCSINHQVRLVNSTETESTIEGRVELCYSGVWTPICSGVRGLSRRLVFTLCSNISNDTVGRDFGSAVYDGRYGMSPALANVYCSSRSNSTGECEIQPNTSSYCTFQIGLKCFSSVNCTEGEVRLVNGTVEREGRLEVCTNGVWAGVCEHSFASSNSIFDSSEVESNIDIIMCSVAGYTDVKRGLIYYFGNRFGDGNGLLVHGSLYCPESIDHYGNNTMGIDCTMMVNVDTSDCHYFFRKQAIGLFCPEDCNYGDVRLVGGRHANEGFVEICVIYYGWTLLAQIGWDDNDAMVVCRQLGAQDGTALENTNFTRPRRAVRYTNVMCNGTESRLSNCRHHNLSFDTGRLYSADVAAVNCGDEIRSSDEITKEVGIGLGITLPLVLIIGLIATACIARRIWWKSTKHKREQMNDPKLLSPDLLTNRTASDTANDEVDNVPSNTLPIENTLTTDNV